MMQNLTEKDRLVLQRASREEMIMRLLNDIAADAAICNLEGWNVMDYITRIKREMDHFVCVYNRKKKKVSNKGQLELFTKQISKL